MKKYNNPSESHSILKYHVLKASFFKSTNEDEEVLRRVATISDGTEYPIEVSKIIYSSDATPGILSASVFNYDVTSINDPYKTGFNSNINTNGLSEIEPGDGFCLFMYTDENTEGSIYSTRPNNGICIFRGYVDSVSRTIDEKGIRYSIQAKDRKVRLMDQTIKKTYNAVYKAATSPNVRERDDMMNNPYLTEKMTVKEIVDDIIDYANSSALLGSERNIIFFEKEDFDYNGLNALKDFIPPTISFDGDTILEAIYKLINTAGPYRIVYDQNSEKIYFTKIDSNCTKCGKEI